MAFGEWGIWKEKGFQAMVAIDIEREVERGTYDAVFQLVNVGGFSRQGYRPAAVVRDDERWVKSARQRAVWDDGAAAVLVASALGRLA